MEKVYPDTYYATIYEDFKQKDGDSSFYYKLMFNPTFVQLIEGCRSTTKRELKERLDEIMANLIKLDEYTSIEVEHGWKYERFIKWLDDDLNKYEIVNDGSHTDHEVYTADISFYEDVYGIFSKLKD